jgi:aryl-alcohol dehydrogenase-like predicted oxidoreductase
MRYRALGASGIEASVIGFGAWAAGGWMWGGADETDAIRAIHIAVDMGVNLIDTAAVYGFGASEEIVGKAIAGRRQRVVIATKCGLVWDGRGGDHFFDSEGKQIHRYLAAHSIRLEVEQSLKRLSVDTIDLYQTHRQDPSTPIAETMETLLALQLEGKIRAIGVSNATSAQMEQYRALGPLDTDQESYSMLSRAIEADQLPYCREHGIAMLAYSPMARGLLTGKISPDHAFAPGDHRATHPLFTVESRTRVATLLERCRPVAERHGVTSGQLAIAWALAQPGVTHALVGARNPDQVAENIRAADIELAPEDLGEIDAALAGYQA